MILILKKLLEKFMMKNLFMAFVCLLSVPCHSSLFFDETSSDDHFNASAHHPYVCCVVNEEKSCCGTGVLCTLDDKKFILTAAHVAADGSSIQVLFRYSSFIKVTSVNLHPFYQDTWFNRLTDIALLFLEEYPPIEPLNISHEDFNPDEPITAVGFGKLGFYDSTGRGHYAKNIGFRYEASVVEFMAKKFSLIYFGKNTCNENDYHGLEKVFSDNHTLKLEGALSNGDSGGPLIQNHKLVGLTVSSYRNLIDIYSKEGLQPIYRSLNPSLGHKLNVMEGYFPPHYKPYFRHVAKWLFNLPDFSVRAGVRGLCLGPALRVWIKETLAQ